MRKFNKVIYINLIILLVLCANSGYAESGDYTSIENSVPTISVQGKGKVVVQPDEATLQFGVTNEGKKVSEAYRSNTTSMNSVIATIKSLGIIAKDIKTSSYTVTPVYPKNEQGRLIPGKPVLFRISQQLTVKVSDLSKVGTVIDKAIAYGTNVFSGILFSSSKIYEFEKEAKVKSATDAKEKATLLAESLGVTLGRVLKVDESSARPSPMRNMALYESMTTDAAPQIEAGSMEVNASCNVIYEIIQ